MRYNYVPGTAFKDQNHSGILTISNLQYALIQSGLDPFDNIIWDEQRRFVATLGVYVVTPLDDGRYRLDIRDRGDVNPRGTYDTETDVVRAFLAEANPRPSPDQDRVLAASRRAYVENKSAREIMKKDNQRLVERVLRERAAAGLPLDPTIEEEPRSDDE